MSIELPTAEPGLSGFIAELLADQQRLQTPAARLAAAWDAGRRGRIADLGPQLIPLTAPRPGEQFAFEVDLDSCTGCKACVAACHSLNGLDENETWRDVGQLVSDDPRHPFVQAVTTSCHHCADPGCLNGCPVLAYEKDPVTGIVRHLDDQCIGCSYCILKCPYDAPKFNAARGIVRKCDLCQDRLSAGEAPACVQACPTYAIRIVSVPVDGAGDGRPTPGFLDAAADYAITRPTTRYLSRRRPVAPLIAADAYALRPEWAHTPLGAMLTLAPMGIACVALAALRGGTDPALARLGWLAGLLGLGASVLHLGQPLRAWRVFLGLRRSWLSREVLGFGLWFLLATVAVVPGVPVPLRRPFALAASVVGLVGLACSVMVYVDTRREFWRWQQTAPRFVLGAAVLGLAAWLAVGPARAILPPALMAAMLLKLAVEVRVLQALDRADPDAPFTAAVRTARLLTGPLRPLFGARLALGLLGGVALPFALMARAVPPSTAWWGLGLLLLGEFAEHRLFFQAVAAPRMPGVVPA